MMGKTSEDAYNSYSEIEKIDNISGFIERDAAVMHGWLSRYDTMQKYYPVDASNIDIVIGDNSRIKIQARHNQFRQSCKEAGA